MSLNNLNPNANVTGIILAAGKGTRLCGLDKRPKGIIDLGGISPLMWTLKRFQAVGIRPVLIVVGYQSNLIESHLQICFKNEEFKLIHNDIFDKTDTAYSFLLAARLTQTPIILTYADTMVTMELLQRLLCNSSKNILVVDNSNHFHTKSHHTKMDMKVRIKGNNVVDISKEIPDNLADGESTCLFKFGTTARNRLVSLCQRKFNQENRMLWFEAVLAELLSDLCVNPLFCSHNEWCEIDSMKDIETARLFVRDIRGQLRII